MQSLRNFMSGLIDYAGLFPPAKLPMDRAVELYDRYRRADESWMLGRFICPCARMDEFATSAGAMIEDAPSDRPWLISALGGPATDTSDFKAAIEHDLGIIKHLSQRFGDRIRIDAYESRWPVANVTDLDRPLTSSMLQDMMECFEQDAPCATHIFVEIPFVEGWETKVPQFVECIAQSRLTSPRGHRVSLKVRTGGVTADSFPSPGQVACFIDACSTNSIAFKATAGLHHPVRHYNESVNTKMHGFLNVFGGAILRAAGAIDREGLLEVLNDEQADAFAFSQEGFRWRDCTASKDEVAKYRDALAISYGSCSFDEPIDDLRALGMF